MAMGKKIQLKINKAKLYKAVSVAATIFTVIIVVFSLILIISSAIARKKGKVPAFFGYMFFIVITDSMQPAISPGDFIFAGKVSAEEVKAGDYIVYYSMEPRFEGMLIVHKVNRVEEQDGSLLFYTQGINSPAEDTYPTSEVLGIYKGKLQLMSGVIKIFQNRTGILVLGAVVVFLLIAAGQVKKITAQINSIKAEKEAAAQTPSPEVIPEATKTKSEEGSEEPENSGANEEAD